MKNRNGCLICGQELKYSDEYHIYSCYYCQKSIHSNVTCLKNHFVCDQCHAMSGIELIETFCNNSVSINPVEIANEIMHSEKISMHGPEHHFLVPAVLISAYFNVMKYPDKKKKIEIAKQRAIKVPGGFCGTHGNCGAGVGNGIFISIITKSTPLAKEEWSLSNQITGRSLLNIAEHGGPRCCKRDVYLSLTEAIRFLKEKFNVALESQEIVCRFSVFNKECLHKTCIFHDHLLS